MRRRGGKSHHRVPCLGGDCLGRRGGLGGGGVWGKGFGDGVWGWGGGGIFCIFYIFQNLNFSIFQFFGHETTYLHPKYDLRPFISMKSSS